MSRDNLACDLDPVLMFFCREIAGDERACIRRTILSGVLTITKASTQRGKDLSRYDVLMA